MSKQTEDMERRIMSIAGTRLDEIQAKMASERVAAVTGDDEAKQRYADMVTERGRLQQVIATAREALGPQS